MKANCYVQKEGVDVWHFARNCSKLPFVIKRKVKPFPGKRPSSGELCNECLSKETHGTLLPINGQPTE